MKNVKQLTVDIIGKCQNSCVFCYNKQKEGRMSFASFKPIVESMPSLKRVDIGGGEPFLHTELVRITRFCLDHGLKTDISTNALIYPQEIMPLALQFPELLTLQASLSATEEQSYNNTTRTKGKFQLFLHNLKKLAKDLKNFRLRLTLCKENKDQLGPAALFAQELEVPLIVHLMLPINGNASHMLSKDEVEEAYCTLLLLKIAYPRIYPGWKNFSEADCPAVAEAYHLPLIGSYCTASHGTKAYINSSGERRGCEFLG